jgi:dihydroxy-acid dehydratase
VDLPDDELDRRRAAWQAPPADAASGYVWLYREFVQGADQGADLSFLRGSRGSGVPRDSH